MESFYFTEKEELDNFIKSAADMRGAEFLQSWQWGEILQAEKEEILRIGVKENGNEKGKKAEADNGKVILAVSTIVKKSLGGGYGYWYSPRGAIFKSGFSEEKRGEAEKFLYGEIRKIDKRMIFLRVEPKDMDGLKATVRANGSFKIKKTLDLQPKQTLILDLSQSEDELLKAMHQKTRYNINLAIKKDIEIKEGGSADFPEFWRLMNLTGARDDFRLHEAKHYLNLLNGQEAVGEDKNHNNFIRLYSASYNGKNIAAGLFCFWGDKATYMHGASDNEFRNVMAPYLLQWSMIRKAKNEGYKYYDFYGIDEKKWPGVTRFKLGFGGRVENYPGTYDVIFRPAWYGFYELIRKVKRFI